MRARACTSLSCDRCLRTEPERRPRGPPCRHGPLGCAPVRIWVDMTAPAHPLVLRPVIERLRAHGHEVEVTARDYAQTLPILERLGIPHVTIGAHGGASRRGKLRALAGRTRKMVGFGRRGFDLALAHGSNDLALAAAALRVPAVNTFDYEWATQQHNIGCRLARRVIVPEAIPPERLYRYGVRGGQAGALPGAQGGVLPVRLRARCLRDGGAWR